LCVLSQCAVLTDLSTNKQYVPGTSTITTPACELQCKAGYYGNTASNPTTCTACIAGTSSAAGSAGIAACIPCSKGYFSAAAGSATCTPCTPVAGVNTFADVTGSTTCAPCVICTNGKWKSSCGGEFGGTCSVCIN
jgi:hypothetical protein